ncbi:MAG: TerB family tellurite resistance protein [Rhodothermales bacterium]
MPPQAPIAADDLHTLVLLYLSVAYESDRNFDPAEHHIVLRLLRWWMPDLTTSDAEAIVDTAHKAVRSGMSDSPDVLARTMGAALSPKLRRRVLSDLGQIAQADGFLSVEEASTIRRIRTAFDMDEANGEDSAD